MNFSLSLYLFIYLLIHPIRSECIEGEDDCLKCQGGICVECKYGGVETNPNGVNYGTCVSCPARCRYDCEFNVHQCTKCNEYYHLDNNESSPTYNQCISCPENCEKCDDNGECLQCKQTYGLTIEKKCSRCTPSKCYRCEKNVDYCEDCNMGYYVKNGQCVKNEDHCLNHYNDRCQKCILNYGLNENPNSKDYLKCVKCSKKIRFCADCKIDKNGYKSCNHCKGGYYLKNYECRSCTNNCSICYDDKTCIKCRPRFHLSDSKCTPCLDSKCLQCPESPSICHECENNYVNLNGKCILSIPKIEGCLIQIDENKCSKCISGYGLDINQKCIKCLSPNCIDCNDDYEKCTKCFKQGQVMFILHEDHICRKTCRDPKCDQCDYETFECKYCVDGYFLNSNKQCEQNKIENCKKYNDNSQTCQKCSNGFHLTEDSHKTCEKCIEDNCAECNYDGECYQCESGFHLTKDKKCIKCKDENCAECSNSEFICDKCKKEYGLDLRKGSSTYGKCVNCEKPYCDSCDGLISNCDGCIDSYYWNGIECTLSYYFKPGAYSEYLTDDTEIEDDDIDDYEEDDEENEKISNSFENENSNSFENEISNSFGFESSNFIKDMETDTPRPKKKLSNGAIAGICVGVIAVVGIVVGVSIYCVLKKKKVAVSCSSN